MICPYCQQEMEEGYIPFQIPYVLKWISSVDEHEIRISDKLNWLEAPKIGNIYYCKDCNAFLKKN